MGLDGVAACGGKRSVSPYMQLGPTPCNAPIRDPKSGASANSATLACRVSLPIVTRSEAVEIWQPAPSSDQWGAGRENARDDKWDYMVVNDGPGDCPCPGPCGTPSPKPYRSDDFATASVGERESAVLYCVKDRLLRVLLYCSQVRLASNNCRRATEKAAPTLTHCSRGRVHARRGGARLDAYL